MGVVGGSEAASSSSSSFGLHSALDIRSALELSAGHGPPADDAPWGFLVNLFFSFARLQYG